MENEKNEPSDFITAESLMNMKLDQLPYLVEGLIPQTGLFCLAGSSDTGKSALLRQLVFSICSGQGKFLGFKLNTRYGNAIYVSTEDDSMAIAYLLNKFNSVYPPESLRTLHFLFNTEKYLQKIVKLLEKEQVDLIIFDAFGDLFDGQLNASNEVRQFLDKFKNLSEYFGCAIGFLHHMGKRTEERQPSKSNLLGSQGIEGKMRLVLELRRDLNSNNIRHLCIVKGNYIPDDQKGSSYVLHFQNMSFKNTGARIPFNELVPNNSKVSSYPKEVQEVICELIRAEKSYREIAEILNKRGIEISKSMVGNLAKNCPPVQPAKESVDTGQDDTKGLNTESTKTDEEE
jgi:RecA-family ATPase